MTKAIRTENRNTLHISQNVKKLLLSSAVVFTFGAYAVHDRVSGDEGGVVAPNITPKPNQVSAAQPAQPTTKPATSNTARTNGSQSNGAAQPKLPTTAPSLVPVQPTATDLPTQVPPTPIPPTDVPPTDVPPAVTNGLRDGQYQGDVTDAYYGNVQVQATIQGGQITSVNFLDYPHDRRTSQRINSVAMPYLQSEAIQAQNANVDIISGATLTSEAFIQSLQSALNRARG